MGGAGVSPCTLGTMSTFLFSLWIGGLLLPVRPNEAEDVIVRRHHSQVFLRAEAVGNSFPL